MEITNEILARLAPTAEGMDVYLDQRNPELEDPARALSAHEWQPACNATNRLTRCLEAIRDISTTLAPLKASAQPNADKRLVKLGILMQAIPILCSAQPNADKRLVKQVITPIYNLAIAVRDLFNYVQSNCWTMLDKQKQLKLTKRLKQFGEAVPTGCGILKTARDKIAAHLDKNAWTWEYRQFWDAFSCADILKWINGCLRLFEVLLSPDIYSWTRCSGYSNVRNLMSADGWEMSLLMKEGNPERFVGCKLVVSPKAAIVREARELAATCATLEQRLDLRVEQTPETDEEVGAGE